MITSLLTFFIVGIVALVALSIVLALVGVVFSVAFALLGVLIFKVLPILLIGYIVVRMLAPKRRRELSAADREWLES